MLAWGIYDIGSIIMSANEQAEGAREAEDAVKDAALATYGLNDAQELAVATLTKDQQNLLQLNDDYINAKKAAEAKKIDIRPFIMGDNVTGKFNTDEGPKLAKAVDDYTKSTGKTVEEIRGSWDDMGAIIEDANLENLSPAQMIGVQRALEEYLEGIPEYENLADIANEKHAAVSAEADRMGISVSNLIDATKRIGDEAKRAGLIDTLGPEVEFLEAMAFGGAEGQSKSELKALRKRKRLAMEFITNQERIAEIAGPMAGIPSAAAASAMSAEQTTLTGRNKAIKKGFNKRTSGGGGGPDATAVNDVQQQAAGGVGYSETVAGKGAIVKFDKGSYDKFLADIRTMRKVWVNNIEKMVTKMHRFVNQLKQMHKNAGAEVTSMKTLGKTLADAFIEGFGGAADGLLKKVNEILDAANQAPIAVSFEEAKGDSPDPTAGMGGFSIGGGIGGGSSLNELASSQLTTLAKAMISAVGGGTVTSVKSNHSAFTSTGKPSQHGAGMAFDFVTGGVPQMNAAGAFIQKNAGKFGVNAAQVFYPNNDPDGNHGSQGGRNAHVHVGFGGAAGVTDTGNLSAMDFTSTLGNMPNFVGEGSITKMFNSLGNLTEAGVNGAFAERMFRHGGEFTAHRPMTIGVGEAGPEDISVQPTRRRKQGGGGNGKTTVINSTINLGNLIADESGIEMLTEKIGQQFRRDLKTAQKTTRHEDE